MSAKRCYFRWMDKRKANAMWLNELYTVYAENPFVVGQGKTLSEAVAEAMAEEKRKADQAAETQKRK